jgi:hypothetical protein
MWKLGILSLALLGGCATGPNVGGVLAKPPSRMDQGEIAIFNELPLFAPAFNASLCSHRKSGVFQVSAADDEAYRRAFAGRGLSARDVEIILNPSADYGTRMTFLGLQCSAGRPLEVNKSFYQGIGHNWQVPFGSGYVYLEGDGTERGMRVTSWN